MSISIATASRHIRKGHIAHDESPYIHSIIFFDNKSDRDIVASYLKSEDMEIATHDTKGDKFALRGDNATKTVYSINIGANSADRFEDSMLGKIAHKHQSLREAMESSIGISR